MYHSHVLSTGRYLTTLFLILRFFQSFSPLFHNVPGAFEVVVVVMVLVVIVVVVINGPGDHDDGGGDDGRYLEDSLKKKTWPFRENK